MRPLNILTAKKAIHKVRYTLRLTEVAAVDEDFLIKRKRILNTHFLPLALVYSHIKKLYAVRTYLNSILGYLGVMAKQVFLIRPRHTANLIRDSIKPFLLTAEVAVYNTLDAALTHQHQGDTQQLLTMKNVSYTHCLVEDCVYAIEYFLGREDTIKEHYMLNVRFERNILRRAGMGWGNQRPDKITPAIIKSWSHHNNRAFNYVIRRNIFDRSTFDLLNIGYRDSYSAPRMERNTYIQYLNADGGHLGQERTLYRYDEAFPAVMERIFGETKGKYIFIEK